LIGGIMKGILQLLLSPMARIRPQVFLALMVLGILGFGAMRGGYSEIAVGSIAGIIALAKDVLQADAASPDKPAD
tara:strand:+ start:202 stop:426 length:225 start_codon:yes stop_codon:yes gene_type:complete